MNGVLLCVCGFGNTINVIEIILQAKFHKDRIVVRCPDLMPDILKKKIEEELDGNDETESVRRREIPTLTNGYWQQIRNF